MSLNLTGKIIWWSQSLPNHHISKCLLCYVINFANRPLINTLRPRQDGRHFPDDIFKCIFLNENVWISIRISLKFVPKGPINNIPVLVQIMAWRWSGDKPLSEPMMVSLLTRICVTRPQWVNWANTALFSIGFSATNFIDIEKYRLKNFDHMYRPQCVNVTVFCVRNFVSFISLNKSSPDGAGVPLLLMRPIIAILTCLIILEHIKAETKWRTFCDEISNA